MDAQALGANFTIDITDLKAGLQQANRIIKESESEFKAAAAGMDDWTKSADGLQARIKSLTTTTDAQRKKVSALKADYSRLVAEGLDETSKAAAELRTKINQEQAALAKNEKELKDQTKALEDLGKESEDAGKATGDLGKSAESTGGGFTIAKGAIAGFVANALTALISKALEGAKALLSLAESTREFREDTARLSAAFEGAGFSAESAEKTYTSLYRAIGETDTAVEAAQQIALLANSEEEAAKWAELATGVVATFGDSLKVETFMEAANETLKLGEATGAFTQMLEGTGVNVEDFNKKLQACSTEAEKQAYLLEVSEKALGSAGKAYEEAAGDILDAREAMARLEQAQADLGAAAEPLSTAITNLKTSLLEGLSPALKEVFADLSDVLAGVEGSPERLANTISSAIGEITAKATEFIPKVGEFAVQLIGMLAQVIVEQTPAILDALLQMAAAMLTTLSNMAPSLVMTITDAVLDMADTILDNLDVIIDAAIALIMALADGLMEALPRLVEKIPEIVQRLADAVISNLPKILDAGVKIILELINGIIKAVPDLYAAMPQIIVAIVKGLLTEGIPALIDAGAQLLQGLFEGMLNPQVIWENIKKIGNSILSAVKDFFGIHSPSRVFRDQIGEFLGEGMALGLGDGFESQMKAVGARVTRSAAFDGGIIRTGQGAAYTGAGEASAGRSVTINQNNYYSKSTGSRYERFRAKQDAAAAVRLALATGGGGV